MSNNIDKRTTEAKRLGIVSFPANTARLTLSDIDLRKDCIVAGLVPIRSTLSMGQFQQHTDDWYCYYAKFRKLDSGEIIPYYKLDYNREGDVVSIEKVTEIKLKP